MATIKPIEARSVHQIQSGQVIVDLNSVVKELVENSLDAGSTSIEIRFKNSGLDAVEVQDNGNGIAPEDYGSIALKHYTSKLSSYNDLSKLSTFGFRGEALSSLCGLSTFFVTTARAEDGPKGTRLDFETSGKLKSRTLVASQKGTTVTVEQIFKNLPVRRKELERNIKREYQKVLHLLNAYACISVGVRFVVSNLDAKGKRNVVFSTNASSSTKNNIASVFGAKMLQSLVPLDLKFELKPSALPSQAARNWTIQDDVYSREIHIVGHISRPVVGEGRQAADRQLFFVNSRPCGLPQLAKAFNEVYRSYNVTQSPFVFADLKLDTNAYDVNVSPDKRTILLHDQTALLETLKEKLIELFDGHEQSVPDSNTANRKLPSFNLPTTIRPPPVEKNSNSVPSNTRTESSSFVDYEDQEMRSSLLRKFVSRNTVDRVQADVLEIRRKQKAKPEIILPPNDEPRTEIPTEESPKQDVEDQPMGDVPLSLPPAVRDFNRALGVDIRRSSTRLTGSSEIDVTSGSVSDDVGPQMLTVARDVNQTEDPIPSSMPSSKPKSLSTFQSSLDRMRRHRPEQDTAVVTIGNATTITAIGSPKAKRRKTESSKPASRQPTTKSPILIKSLRAFAAPGTQFEDEEMNIRAATSVNAIKSRVYQGDDEESDDESDSLAEADTTTSGEADPEVLFDDGEPEGENSEASDAEYVDELEKKVREEAKVAQLIAAAEKKRVRPTEENVKRAKTVLQAQRRRDSTLQLSQQVTLSMDLLDNAMKAFRDGQQRVHRERTISAKSKGLQLADAEEEEEERLALTVSKSDFSRMQVIGQFNLGFILALRPASTDQTPGLDAGRLTDELFIIDQHASDEKFNFERLQLETTVQNQPLVHPKILELTAVEEELLANNPLALAKNGFQVSIDTSGDKPVGRRCKLTSLPMSKEVVFDHRDLEELLALLLDDSGTMLATSTTAYKHRDQHGDSTRVLVPRPSKVRRMFAMRACRSSIMVGKHLTEKQMTKVIKHMGEIDKPWNCPHGRPTMRHLFGLGAWEGWSEGDGLVGMEGVFAAKSKEVDWATFAEAWGEEGNESEGGSGDYDEDEEDIDEGDEDEEMEDEEF